MTNFSFSLAHPLHPCLVFHCLPSRFLSRQKDLRGNASDLLKKYGIKAAPHNPRITTKTCVRAMKATATQLTFIQSTTVASVYWLCIGSEDYSLNAFFSKKKCWL